MTARDLWDGAEVRFVGPPSSRAGTVLQPGDRAVVVDAGRHHLTSSGALIAIDGTRRPRRRGVRIRTLGGAEASVPRQHLELVAPDHPLAPEPDGSHAAWWLERLAPWGERVPVRAFVPDRYPMVCQVLHPFVGDEAAPSRWDTLERHPGVADVAARLQTRYRAVEAYAHEAGLTVSTGELDPEVADALVDVLTTATSTPDDVFVAVWTGWGDVPPQRFPGAAQLDTEARGHLLLRGPLVGVHTSASIHGFGRPVAGIWWPRDRAWFVVTEIDSPWTFVAGDDALLGHLRADDRLEVRETTFDAPASTVAPLP